MKPQSLFLALPLEIRYVIYSHLCSMEPISYPWKFSPISSINIRPPPLALQRTCRFLFAEVQSYYYGRATLRFINPAIQPPFSGEHRVACAKAIRQAKRIEILLIWNITAEQTKSGYQSWSMNLFLPALVDLLQQEGEILESVTLSLKDASEHEVDWSFRRDILAALSNLPPTVRFVVGEVTAADDREEKLKQQVEDHVVVLDSRS